MRRLWSKIKNYFTPPEPVKVPEQYEVHRLSSDAYEQLVSRLPKPGIPRNGEEAAFMVGVQIVLAELREGYVVG